MKKKIVFTGGGTLGHVMPNLYLAEELKNDYDISYIGTDGLEHDRVIKEIDDYHTIPAVKLVRGKIFTNLKIPFVLIKSIFKSKKELKEIKPDVIFSKGGYVSLPVCIAGRMLKIPIISHESDYSFGLANKMILKLSNTMCVNFAHLEEKNKKITYSGPIFSRDFDSDRKDKSNLNINPNKSTILIVGGSLGSQKINEIIFAIVRDLLPQFNIIHIVGKGNNKLKSYDNYNAIEQTEDMVSMYNIADFVIGRSGAGVTAECFYKHLPMILIPLENKSTRGDQLLNAKHYEKMNVATVVREKDLTPTKLLDEINKFSANMSVMKSFYHKLNQENGREKIINLIKSYSNVKENKKKRGK